MRVMTFLVALGLLVGAGTSWACPMQNAAKDQNLASSNSGPSTPIPAKSRQGQKS
ncbi:MAG: hypothetical protein ACJ8H8_18210 [Geminicoccaceae bacterium]